MIAPRVGFDVEDLHAPVKDALRWIAVQRRTRVELPTAAGETAPRNLSASGRRHLSRYVEGLGLGIAALTADIPGLRLTDPRTVDERVERTCEAIDLAREFRVPIVTASVGALTHPESGAVSEVGAAALRRIGEFADSRGVAYALRPSQDTAERFQRVLEALGCPSLGLALDPAAMVMQGGNPMALIARFGREVRLVHARDATAGLPGQPGYETKFGEGEVDLIGLAQALRDLDFHGPIIARRYDAADPQSELLAASAYLGKLLKR